ncbi:MAG: 2,3-bisphosphoglycerate-independent phosphoglycerate mutase [Desulfobacteraceae bacterium]|nr:2,3-bisphosphoglycerate-independent phosphoglycerate mutase [Desulfobacteraceae bacterium]
MNDNNAPVNMLMILDGWGIKQNKENNAFALAHTPFLDSLINTFPSSKLLCSGNAVGLPDGTMGNSEVGHMNIGAGRKVLQDFVRINTAIENGSFFKTFALCNIMDKTIQNNSSLHLIGLLSDGGVHSHISHLFSLIDMAKEKGVQNLYIHAILDGRDTPPKSGINYMQKLVDYLTQKNYGKIATITGRYWAMDRDTRWDRTQKAYDMYTKFTGKEQNDPVKAVQFAYDSDETDEFIKPLVMDKNDRNSRIKDRDGLIFYNFRTDRAKQITRAFTEKGFTEFDREKQLILGGYVCMTQYDETFDLPVAFGPQHLNNILGEIISRHNIAQLRIAETEKYAHVTYFFNGGDEKIFKGEERLLIPSPRDVATYDLKPEMSAFEVAKMACEKIKSRQFPFIVLNFANMDMVGHTGILEAAIKACETVDQCVQKVVEEIWKTKGFALVTADHGNSEQMVAKDGSPHTAHTLNPVRLVFAADGFKGQAVKDGILGDIAPTILKLMDIDQPSEMTGTPLI